MQKIYKDITATIGNTPMVYLNNINKGLNAKIVVKIESFNPMGSIKDRIGYAMLEEAEKQGLLNKDTVIIEATSGNTGIALAFVAAAREYKIKLVMPETMSLERRKLLKALGAELILTTGSLGMKGAVDKAEEIVAQNPKHYFMPKQFQNPVNSAIHYKTTAEEIWEATEGEVDILISTIGTGGTFTGISKFIKEKKSTFKAIAVEPAESPLISGGNAGSHGIQGIGAGFIPEVLDQSLIDEVITVNTEDAIITARKLAKYEGIFSGISSGAAVHVALEVALRSDMDKKMIVVILPDTGERYLTTDLFNF